MSGQFADGDGLRERMIRAANSAYGTDAAHTLIVDAVLPVVRESSAAALLDGSQDVTLGAVGENPNEPTDPEVRDLAAVAYLVVTCQALGIDADEEWDAFEYARAIHRRVRAVLGLDGKARCGALHDTTQAGCRLDPGHDGPNHQAWAHYPGQLVVWPVLTCCPHPAGQHVAGVLGNPCAHPECACKGWERDS